MPRWYESVFASYTRYRSVGQTIRFRRLLFRACGPRNFMKNRTSPRGGGLSWVLGLHVFSMAYTGFSTLPLCFGRSRTEPKNRGHISSRDCPDADAAMIRGRVLIG